MHNTLEGVEVFIFPVIVSKTITSKPIDIVLNESDTLVSCKVQ